MKVKFIVTKEIIRKRFEEIAQDIKNRGVTLCRMEK